MTAVVVALGFLVSTFLFFSWVKPEPRTTWIARAQASAAVALLLVTTWYASVTSAQLREFQTQSDHELRARIYASYAEIDLEATRSWPDGGNTLEHLLEATRKANAEWRKVVDEKGDPTSEEAAELFARLPPDATTFSAYYALNKLAIIFHTIQGIRDHKIREEELHGFAPTMRPYLVGGLSVPFWCSVRQSYSRSFRREIDAVFKDEAQQVGLYVPVLKN